MEEKARGKVKVKSESSHPHTWENVGSSPRGSEVARERFVWSPDQRYQFKGHLCAGNRVEANAWLVVLSRKHRHVGADG